VLERRVEVDAIGQLAEIVLGLEGGAQRRRAGGQGAPARRECLNLPLEIGVRDAPRLPIGEDVADVPRVLGGNLGAFPGLGLQDTPRLRAILAPGGTRSPT
jgi:hypothetical protein